MLIYFSGTGNCLCAANTLALPDEPVVSLKQPGGVAISPAAERVGFVFPVYWYGLPSVCAQAISRLDLPREAYIFACFTYNSGVGAAAKELSAMNLLFFLTPKQDVLYIYEDFTLRQTLEKWSNQRFATIPVLKRNGEYLGTMTEGDILWGIKSIHGLDIDASEDIPIASFPRRRDYKAVPVTTDMHALLNAAVDQNFVPVVDDRNVFIGIVRRTAILQQVAKDYESPKGNVIPETAKSKARKEAAFV